MTKPKPDNPEQFKRFIQTAREVGADEGADALDRALEKVLPRKRQVLHRDPVRRKPNPNN
jgi:hypothetical protein